MSRFIFVADASMLLALIAVTTKLYYRRSRNPLNLPLPPGPKQSIIPFVGNIPDMPTKDGVYSFQLPTAIQCQRN